MHANQSTCCLGEIAPDELRRVADEEQIPQEEYILLQYFDVQKFVLKIIFGISLLHFRGMTVKMIIVITRLPLVQDMYYRSAHTPCGV